MEIILGLVIIFGLGCGIGAWACYDWLRHRGLLRTSATNQADLFTGKAIADLLSDYGHGVGGPGNYDIVDSVHDDNQPDVEGGADHAD